MPSEQGSAVATPDVDEEVETLYCEWCDDDNGDHASADHVCAVCGGTGHDVGSHPYCNYCDANTVHDSDDHRCSNCGDRMAYHDYCDYCEETTCGCDHGHDYEAMGIQEYNWKPDTIDFHGDVETQYVTRMRGGYPAAPDAQTYLGLEVECEGVHCGPGELAQVWNDSGLGWVATDGSLTDEGVECKTAPATYGALERRLPLESTLVRLAKVGGRAWGPGHCGLHIHVNRKAFSGRAHAWRFAAAHEAMSTEFRTLSGRQGDESYCQWPKKADSVEMKVARQTRIEWFQTRYERAPTDSELSGYPEWQQDGKRATKVIAGKALNSDRYVNLNVCEKTIELRFWRGSLRPSHVLGACALADAMVEYTRGMRFPDVRAGITWSKFQTWAAANLPSGQVTRIVNLATLRGVEVAPEMFDRVEEDARASREEVSS